MPENLDPPRAFDHFVLLEAIGAGGMGSVYKARDTQLDRFVALKLLRPELSADPPEAARLEQEARLTAAVNHPHVVQVYSAGRAHGQLYLVMELVAHGSLDDLMAQSARLPEAQVLQTGIQVARGLQAAHEKGLIHRDVKPANILFAHAGTAKIGDFGLAVAAGQRAEAQKEIWGTPYYVAPERLDNEPEDFRSDIYSLGATLFHALAGRPPFEGNTTSASELRRLKNNPPDLRAVAPEISKATARIVNQMLAPDPSARFASYTELLAQLEQAARAQGTGKNPRWSLGIAATALALATLIAAGIYFARGKTPVPAATPNPMASTAPGPAADDEAAAKLVAEETGRTDEQRRRLAAESPGWVQALAAARTSTAVYDFSTALATIDAAKVSEPSLAKARDSERQKIGWLLDWKKKLIADLNAKRFSAPVQIGPANFTGAAQADDARITFRLPPYGTAAVDWAKIPAKTLLAISLSVFQPTDPDAPDRQWLAAIFALRTGQPEAARSLAETAAQAKLEYREHLRRLPLAPPE